MVDIDYIIQWGEMMKGFVSVIVPVYNSERYIARCLDSIINQSYDKLEIIVVDDGSQDDSKTIIEKYSKLDKRIIFIQKENGGVSSARNVGLAVASGEYISFVDSDDWIDKDMFADMLRKMQEAELCICGYRKIFPNGSACSLPCKNETEYARNELIRSMFSLKEKHFFWEVWGKLFKHSCVDDLRFNTEITHCEDMLFMWEIIKKIKKSIYISGSYYNYAYNDNGASNNSLSVKGLSAWKAVSIIWHDCQFNRENSDIQQAIKLLRNHFAITHFRNLLYLNDNSMFNAELEVHKLVLKAISIREISGIKNKIIYLAALLPNKCYKIVRMLMKLYY